MPLVLIPLVADIVWNCYVQPWWAHFVLALFGVALCVLFCYAAKWDLRL